MLLTSCQLFYDNWVRSIVEQRAYAEPIKASFNHVNPHVIVFICFYRACKVNTKKLAKSSLMSRGISQDRVASLEAELRRASSSDAQIMQKASTHMPMSPSASLSNGMHSHIPSSHLSSIYFHPCRTLRSRQQNSASHLLPLSWMCALARPAWPPNAPSPSHAS